MFPKSLTFLEESQMHRLYLVHILISRRDWPSLYLSLGTYSVVTKKTKKKESRAIAALLNCSRTLQLLRLAVAVAADSVVVVVVVAATATVVVVIVAAAVTVVVLILALQPPPPPPPL